MDYSNIFQLVYIDASSQIRRETSLATRDRETALEDFSATASPYSVELWRGSELIASRCPNGPIIVVIEQSSQHFFRTFYRAFRRQPRALTKGLVTVRQSTQTVAAAA